VLAIERTDEDAPIGLVEYETKEHWMTVSFIALAKAYRGWGYGSEAVRLLEEWAAREGMAKRFRAEVPVGNGPGLYFWLRLGHRPAAESTSPDTLTMIRTS
jgi:RimJ/RimL family protein N-acetyltransferase